jgi:hypothetical protein
MALRYSFATFTPYWFSWVWFSAFEQEQTEWILILRSLCCLLLDSAVLHLSGFAGEVAGRLVIGSRGRTR